MIAAESAEQRIVFKLLGEGTLTSVGLAAMRRESELMGLPLVEILQSRDVISEFDLAQVYADLSGFRFLDLTRRRPTRAWVLTLPENIARGKNCILFGEVSGQLVVAVADPVDPSVFAAISSRFERPIQYVVSPRYQIIETIEDIYGSARAGGARLRSAAPVSTPTATSATASSTGLNMIEQLDSILDEAVDRRASDVHVEPEEDRVRVRMRIDGRMIEVRAYPVDAAAAAHPRPSATCDLALGQRAVL
ncbi:MAG: hypothetical protein KJ749_15220, partial [Planctomycetes bacterium]|nr:hypothetical protein [Planctomycetota bacterium]